MANVAIVDYIMKTLVLQPNRFRQIDDNQLQAHFDSINHFQN